MRTVSRFCNGRFLVSGSAGRDSVRVRGQVCKRIARRMAALGIESGEQYRQRLESDPDELKHFDTLCRITISRFHRDRGVFAWLTETGLPELATAALARGATTLRIWSAGCASGEEPYTLAIVWKLALVPEFPALGCEIIATDADEVLLARAARGCYAGGTLRELPEAWKAQAFEVVDGENCVRDEFRRVVTFRREDLREAQPDGPFDLILCRNVAFTYFGKEWQERTLAELIARLVPGGLLVLGAHERPEADFSRLERVGSRPIFRLPAHALE